MTGPQLPLCSWSLLTTTIAHRSNLDISTRVHTKTFSFFSSFSVATGIIPKNLFCQYDIEIDQVQVLLVLLIILESCSNQGTVWLSLIPKYGCSKTENSVNQKIQFESSSMTTLHSLQQLLGQRGACAGHFWAYQKSSSQFQFIYLFKDITVRKIGLKKNWFVNRSKVFDSVDTCSSVV